VIVFKISCSYVWSVFDNLPKLRILSREGLFPSYVLCPPVNSPSILEVGGAFGVQPLPEIEDDFVEDGGVDVLGQLHEDEPVAVVALPEHGGDVVAVHGLDAVAEEQVADVLARHGQHPDHEVDGGPNGESDEPEPEEDVDLLVDDVHGQYAEAVLALDGAGGTVLVEGALGHLGEDAVHGIVPRLDGRLGHAQHVRAVLGELAAEEQVHQVDLEEDVDEIENLAKDELVNVGVVRPEGPQDILDDGLSAGFVLVHAVEDVLIVQVLDEHAELSTFPQLPEIVRDVAEDGLEGEDEADPLVPRVTDLVAFLGPADVAWLFFIPLTVRLGRDAGVRHVLAGDPGQLRGDGEGAVDPAVRVHHAAGHAVHHALNGRPPVEAGHHHDGGAGDEDAEGDAVVELEGAVVDERLLLLEVTTEVADLAVHDLGRWSPLSYSVEKP